MLPLLIGICAGAVLTMIVGAASGRAWIQWLAKPLASTCFVVLAVVGGAFAHGAGFAIAFGLMLSWVGDVFLLGRSRTAFLIGLIAFLLGHVAYVVAFVVAGVGWSVVPPLLLAALVAAPIARWLLPHVEPAMKRPVIAYMVVISTMLGCAIGSAIFHQTFVPALGAAMFYVSDLSVARDRMVAASWVNKLWGWPLYYAGQMLLAAWSAQP